MSVCEESAFNTPCVCAHIALLVSGQTSECGRGIETHSFHSQLAPEERRWGGKWNLKERGELLQQVTEATEARSYHRGGGPLAGAEESRTAAPSMN